MGYFEKRGINLNKGWVKKSKINFSVVLLLTFIFFSYSPNTSYACSCVEPGSVQEEFNQSVAVFSGKVIGVIDKDKFNPIQSSSDPIGVVFEVDEVWKGINQTQVIVYTSRFPESCGYEFTTTKYLVYANESDGDLSVSMCSRTTLLSAAQEDLNELGLGDKPTEEVKIDLNDTEEESMSPTNKIIFSIAMLIMLIVVAIYIIRLVEKRNLKG